jgi:organic hydroperoxide reductase OsmC/OhrA
LENEENCSPQHLLASINSCLMATFLVTAENSNIQITFDSSTSCIIEIRKGKETITEIILKPKVVIPISKSTTSKIHSRKE